jgi:uncharacterized protein (UPF0332 family)
MKTAFDICVKNKRILVYPQGKNLVEREIRAALDDLADAKIGLAQQRYNWATIQGYYAMFHVARALIFSEGYRETSHYCLAVAIEALYVGTGKLGRELYVYLYAAMGMRANADYRTKFSEESARLIVKRAEEFLEKGQEILT